MTDRDGFEKGGAIEEVTCGCRPRPGAQSTATREWMVIPQSLPLADDRVEKLEPLASARHRRPLPLSLRPYATHGDTAASSRASLRNLARVTRRAACMSRVLRGKGRGQHGRVPRLRTLASAGITIGLSMMAKVLIGETHPRSSKDAGARPAEGATGGACYCCECTARRRVVTSVAVPDKQRRVACSYHHRT